MPNLHLLSGYGCFMFNRQLNLQRPKQQFFFSFPIFYNITYWSICLILLNVKVPQYSVSLLHSCPYCASLPQSWIKWLKITIYKFSSHVLRFLLLQGFKSLLLSTFEFYTCHFQPFLSKHNLLLHIVYNIYGNNLRNML